MGLDEILYLRFANAMLEPIWTPQLRRARPDHDGGELRRRGPRPLLRPRRRAARRRRQPPHAGRRGRGDGGPGRRTTRRPSRTRIHALFQAMPEADPAHYVRGQYDGYREIAGVAPDSTTETYAAMRLEIDNWRWSGVPVLHPHRQVPAGHPDRAATRLHAAAAARLPPRLAPARSTSQLIVKLDPTTGVRLLLEAQRSGAAEPEQISLDMEFAEEGGEGPTPYEVLLHAAMVGRQHALHAPGRRRGGLARACSRCSTRRRRCTPMPRAPGARRRRIGSWPATAAGTSPGSRHERLRRHRDRQRRGRRHARAPARAVGQAHPAARARRLAAARAAELAGPGRVRRQPLRLAGHVVRRGGQAVPAAGALLRRRRDQALRRGALSPARGGLRRAAPPRRDLARVADLLRRDGAVLHARRAALPGPRRARRGSDGAARERAVPVPGREPRAAHPAALRRPRGGRAAPVPRAVRRHARRAGHAAQPLRPVRDVRRLPVPRARQGRRRGARGAAGARARQRDADDQRRGRCGSTRTRADGPSRT